MIHRQALYTLEKALKRQSAVALMGPRQVGKTTLALQLTKGVDALYIDLESPSDRSKLFDPELFLREHRDKLIILDEVHRLPEIFQCLRGLIDSNRRMGNKTGNYLILGSASIDLLKQSSETLAGRIEYVYLNPINVLEFNSSEYVHDLNILWLRGGFPGSLLADNDEDSFVFRKNFIQTYLERDIPQFGFNLPSEALHRLWTMLAHNQGSLLNASRLAASLGVSVPTINRYIDLLINLLLVRRLEPFHANILKRQVKSPKVYIRDSGLLHALLGISTYNDLLGHPVVGASFEGFVIENILASMPYSTRASFYRSSGGAEVDLVLELPNKLGVWAIEIKRSLAVRPDKGFYYALKDINPSRSFIVYPGDDHYKISDSIEVISLPKIIDILAN